jgi:hypothetical protein
MGRETKKGHESKIHPISLFLTLSEVYKRIKQFQERILVE